MAAEMSEGPRDLLRRFCLDETPKASTFDGDSPEPKLTLSLSLGGCFGAEPAESQRLFRSASSSTATLSMLFPGEQELLPSIGRTCSLPTEEVQRKRREMQSLKRLEAKRKRSEKRRSILTAAKEECVDEAPNGGQAKPAPIPFLGFPAPNFEVKLEALGPMPTLVGSHGSCSSNVSDFESQPLPPQEVKSSSAAAAATTAPTSLVVGNPVRPWRKTCGRSDETREAEKSMMEEMPCVSTTGNGPNGRRIEGFLYKYRKGEEVRIVCVCHGSFLTPAEFVKHAGGGDVSHPLRHIVVSPSPSVF